MTFSQVFDAVTKGYGIRRKEWFSKKVVTLGDRTLEVVFDYDTGETVVWIPNIVDLYDSNPHAVKKLRDDWEIVVVDK